MILKPIPDYIGRYEVSDSGKVYSVKRKRFLTNYRDRRNGIWQVKLCNDNGDTRTVSVLRCMAMAFLENPNPLLYDYAVNINGNHDDLRIENVMWGTSSISNRRKLVRQPELLVSFVKSAEPKRGLKKKVTEEMLSNIYQMRKLGYSTKQITEKYNIGKSSIFNYMKDYER